MGCGESRQSTPFREKDNGPSWYITNAQWKSFVESTYTPEFIEESGAKVDCYQLWKDMNATEVNGKYVVGRACYVGKDFVSFGRVLVAKDYWHSYEGTWTSDDVFWGSGKKEDYTIEKTKDGMLICKATGEASQQDQINSVAFQGQGRKLFDDDDAKPKGQKLGDDLKESEGVKAPETEESKKEENLDRIMWRKGTDGKVEVWVTSTKSFAPAEIQYNGYEEIIILQDGKRVGGFKRDITKIPLEHRKFDGSDWVFGDVTPKSEVSNEKCAKFMSLHACRVDESKKILQVVVSLGKSMRGQPQSLTCPIPVNKIAEVKQRTSDHRQWLCPLFYQGRTLWNDDEVMKFMVTWMLVDVAVTMCCFALMSAMMADSAMYAGDAAMYGAADAGEVGGFGFGLLDFF